MPCLIIAEIGVNHNGDMRLALEAIRAAKAAGADAVKFQNYRTEDFISDRNLMYSYCSQGRTATEPQYDLFKRCELRDEDIVMLAEASKQEGLLFLSTPTSAAGIFVLKKVQARYLKNGSDYLSHLPLIREMAKSGIPTILSVGMATLADIDDAVRAFREAGGTDLTLLLCTSAYPAKPEDVHLRKIPVLGSAFGLPVGFSDHTEGLTAAIGAVVLGASMIEKHFTLDKRLPGPDHWFSSDPEELGALVKAVRAVEAQLGHGAIAPTEGEWENRVLNTLSCVAARDLQAGARIAEADIAFRRPGSGIRPKDVRWLLGKTLKRPVIYGTLFSEDDV